MVVNWRKKMRACGRGRVPHDARIGSALKPSQAAAFYSRVRRRVKHDLTGQVNT